MHRQLFRRQLSMATNRWRQRSVKVACDRGNGCRLQIPLERCVVAADAVRWLMLKKVLIECILPVFCCVQRQSCRKIDSVILNIYLITIALIWLLAASCEWHKTVSWHALSRIATTLSMSYWWLCMKKSFPCIQCILVENWIFQLVCFRSTRLGVNLQ